MDGAVVGAGGTVIGVIADAAVPTVALGVSCAIFQCHRSYKVFGFPLLFDTEPMFRNHHHLTPSCEG